MVGEGTERLLELLEGLVARSSLFRWKHRREDFHRISQFLTIDPKLVDVGSILKLAVGSREEPGEQMSEPVAAVGGEGFVTTSVSNTFKEPLHATGPVICHQFVANRLNGLSRDFPSFGEHRHEPFANPSHLGRGSDPGRDDQRLSTKPAREHVKIAGITGRPPNSPQLLLEPRPPLGRQETPKRREGRECPSRGHPQLVHPLGIVSGTAGGGQF